MMPTSLTSSTSQTYGDFITGGGPTSQSVPLPTVVVTINWEAFVDPVDEIRIYRDGAFNGIANNALSTSYTDDSNSLVRGTQYSYQVAPVVGGVEYEKSDPILAWTVPNAPTNVIASAPNDQQQPVSLTWTASMGATGYKIYRGGAYLATSATNSYSDATTIWGTGYEFQISATNSGGEGPKGITVYVTTDPGAPASISASQPSSASADVTVTWTGPATGAATSYNVYRGGVEVGHNVTSPFTDNNTLFITAYSYTVKAVNIVGEEGPASSSSAVTCYAQNATQLKAKNTALGDGTYTFRLADGTLTDIYCNMTIGEGGWMSFASAPSTGSWGTMNTSSSWAGLSLTHGAYNTTGAIGNYWRNYQAVAGPAPTHLLFMSGNKTYYAALPITTFGYPREDLNAAVTLTYTSGNFNNLVPGIDSTKGVVVFRAAYAGQQDPTFNIGTVHSSTTLATCMWEDGGDPGWVNLKNGQGGILVFVRHPAA
eukprot:tig00000144_g9130.t1